MAETHAKKVYVEGRTYTIDESDTTKDVAAPIIETIKSAMTQQTVAWVTLVDDASGNLVSVCINGPRLPVVVIDEGQGPPKPGELSP
jgi:hypothetical protein